MSIFVWIKARDGRKAWTSPGGGTPVPDDRWIMVRMSPWLTTLAEKHGDIEIVTENPEAPDMQSDFAFDAPPVSAPPTPIVNTRKPRAARVPAAAAT